MAKQVTKLTKSQEQKIAGDMPKGVVLDKLQTMHAHNYMSRFYEYADAMDFLCDYLSPELQKKLRKMPKYSISQTAGWIAKYLTNKCTIMPESQAYLDRVVEDIKSYVHVREEKPTDTGVRSFENAQIILLEGLLDRLLQGQTIEFDASAHFKVNETTVTDLKAIKVYYDGCEAQLSDKANKEYFKHPAAVTKRLIAFYRDIDTTIDIILNNKIRERKPRKVKAKPAAKLVSKLRFLKEAVDLKVTSIAAERVISSEQLLMFNVKYNTLIMLYAKPGKKFSTHRTAITEIDETKSVQKTLRKPEINIHKFTAGTKAGVGKAFKELKTVEKKVETFLTNENVVLLRCF